MQAQNKLKESKPLKCYKCGMSFEKAELNTVQIRREPAKLYCSPCLKKMKLVEKKNYRTRTSRTRYFLFYSSVSIAMIIVILELIGFIDLF